MRSPQRPNPQKQQSSLQTSILAPIGGWDARSSIAAMPPQNAVILDNWIPRPGLVELRRGFIPQVVGLPPVESLLPFRGAAGADKLFAAAGGALYDVSTAGPVGAPVGLGFISNRWNYTGFANAAANWTIAANGSDAPIGYHAGSWAFLPTLTFAGPPAFDPTKLFNVFAHKGRLHFLEKGTLHVWNPAAGAVGGAVTLLDLSSIFSKGGELVCGENWSGSLGLTADNFAVYVTNQGQVAVYQGTDPTNASDWALLGVFDLGPPLGPKALVRFGGDLNIITTDGVLPLSQCLTLDRTQQGDNALTKNIVRAFQAAAKSYGGNFGWQAVLYPGASPSSDPNDVGGSLIIVNIPLSSLATSQQYVQSVLGGGWCRFNNPLTGVGLPSFCWEIINGRPYFGSTGGVYQWDQGASDNGSAIIGDVLPAFSAFGFQGRNKEFTMVRPLLNTSSLIAPALSMNVDYQQTPPTATPTVVDQTSQDPEIRFDWTTDGNVGAVGAPYMRVNVQSNLASVSLGVDIAGDILGVDVAGDTLGIFGLAPFSVPVQLLGFDLVFNVAKGTAL